MNDKNITDVDFKEVATEAVTETEVVLFDPVDYLTGALRDAGHPNPTAWTLDIDPRAQTAPSDKDRIFFANRALSLYIAEHTDRENITPRLLLVDGIDKVKWAALMEQGIVPWLMNKFDAKGKLVKETPAVDTTESKEGDFVVEPTYKENDAPVAEAVEASHAQRQTPGVYIKLEDNDPDPQGTVEAVLGDGSETHLWGNIHPNDMPVIMGVDTDTEVLPPADANGNSFEGCKAVTPQRGEVEGLTPLNEFGNPVGTRSMNYEEVVQRVPNPIKVETIDGTVLEETQEQASERLSKLDIDPKYLDVK